LINDLNTISLKKIFKCKKAITMKGYEELKINNEIIAIIIYAEYNKDGIEFFTPGDFSQQLGYMKNKKGDSIQEHTHVLHKREIKYTQETLLIKSGKVRINFFTKGKKYFASKELNAGDVILLASGGHGFEFLEETEMIEIKQGPYCGDKDKMRFKGEKR